MNAMRYVLNRLWDIVGMQKSSKKAYFDLYSYYTEYWRKFIRQMASYYL